MQKEAETLNIGGMVSKLTNKADKLAMIYAVIGDPIAEGRGFSGASQFMIDRIMAWHIPDPAKLLEMVMFYSPYKDNIKNGIMLYIAAEGLSAIGQSKYGNIAKKVAGGLLKGTAAAALLWLPAINPHGVPSNSISQNIAAANSVDYVY